VVYPFAALPQMVPQRVPRILLNLEPVENFGRTNDVFIPGDCDESIWRLCRKLGWHTELINLHKDIGGVEREWEVDSDKLPAKKDEVDAGETLAELTRSLQEELRLDQEEDAEVDRVEKANASEPPPILSPKEAEPRDEVERLARELEEELKLDKEEDLDISRAEQRARASSQDNWDAPTERNQKPSESKDSKEKL
jgi:hypothetical protein